MPFTLPSIKSMMINFDRISHCWRRIASTASVFLVMASGYHLSAAELDQKRLALYAIDDLEQRVATVAHKLAVAGVGHCRVSAPLTGFAVHHLSQYNIEFRRAARTHFGLDQRVQVLSVAIGGAADRAGLKPGDVVTQVDGISLPELNPNMSAATVVFVENVDQIIDEAATDGLVTLAIIRDGNLEVLRVETDYGCQSKVNVKPSNELNAYADGSNVIISTAIAGLARDNAELAAIVAHEFAHNILQHRKLLNERGRDRHLVRFTESEADKLSIHLLDAADFDPNAALRFWERYGPKQHSFFSSSGHPSWRSRIKAMAFEIETLQLAQQP